MRLRAGLDAALAIPPAVRAFVERVTALSEAVTEDRPLEMDLRRLTACIEHGSLMADEPGGQS